MLPAARAVEQVYRVLGPNTLLCGKQYWNIVENTLQSGVVNQKGGMLFKGVLERRNPGKEKVVRFD